MSLPAVEVSQSPEDKFREYLASRPRPQRFTDQQRELLDHVFARHSHFDAEQLIENLKAAGKRVSRATVYRTLKKLVEAGYVSHERSVSDKRSVRVKLTPRGQAIRSRADALYNRQLQAVEEVVGLTADEFDRLNRSLNRLERFWTDQILYRL